MNKPYCLRYGNRTPVMSRQMSFGFPCRQQKATAFRSPEPPHCFRQLSTSGRGAKGLPPCQPFLHARQSVRVQYSQEGHGHAAGDAHKGVHRQGDGQRHAASAAHHGVHHHTHNRAAAEDEASMQITLLLSVSLGLLLLPWASSHPAFLIAPVMLACTPVVGSGVRPLLKEAGLGIIQAVKVSCGLLPKPHPHDQHHGSHHHHQPHPHPHHYQQQQQPPHGHLSRDADHASSSYYVQGQGPMAFPYSSMDMGPATGATPLASHAAHSNSASRGSNSSSNSNSSNSSMQGPASPWPKPPGAHPPQGPASPWPGPATSSQRSSSNSSGSSMGIGAQPGSPPGGSPASSVDYHDFLEHHDRDPRQLSKEQKRERHNHGHAGQPF